MATNLNVAANIYAAKAIKGLPALLRRVSVFSTDFSDEAKKPGDPIKVGLVQADSATDWNDSTANYSGTKMDMKDTDLTLDGRKIVSFAIGAEQVAKFNPAWWEGKAELNMRALAYAFTQSVIAKVTAANFSKSFQVDTASFDLLKLGDLRAKVTDSGIPAELATLNLNSTLYGRLIAQLDSSTYGGPDAVRSGMIPSLFGFAGVVEQPGLSIPGFVSLPSALAFATRVYMPVDKTPYMRFDNITEPESGVTMSSVIFTDGNIAKTTFSNDIVFGSAVGDKDALIRLTTGTK